MKIIVKANENDKIWDCYLKQLSDVGDVIRVSYVDRLYQHANVIITTKLFSDELFFLPDLKAVFLYKTGMDGLPMEELCKRKIEIFNSHAAANLIAEHALTLALCLMHRVIEFDFDLRNNVWFSNGNDYFWTPLCGAKAGIVGFGNIGTNLYKKLCVLGTKTKVLNRSQNYPDGVPSADNLISLIEWCDILFLCLPLTSSTINLIGENEIQKLQGKFLVNVSRGELVKQEVLYQALKSNLLKGYASDVWYHSPDKIDRTKKCAAWDFDFGKLRNIVVSPHCSTHAYGAHEKYINDTVKTAINWILNYKE